MNPATWLELQRIVRFGETDGAGVVHFQTIFSWCHQAWEESLRRFGIRAEKIFPTNRIRLDKPAISLPVVHCEADFLHPLHVGDNLTVMLRPKRLNPSCFEVRSKVIFNDQTAVLGLIRHLAISSASRQRCLLPDSIASWLDASSSK